MIFALDDILPHLLKLAGVAGAFTTIFAYALLQGAYISGRSYTYALMNLCAATLILCSLYSAFNLASAIIQICFIVISVYGVTRMYLRDSRAVLSSTEQEFIDAVFPSMPKPMAREFLNKGTWLSPDNEITITQQDQPVDHLYYLNEGSAKVLFNNNVIATICHDMIGDLSAMQDDAVASATVIVAPDSHLFSISGTALRQLCHQDIEFKAILEMRLNKSLRKKIREANRELSVVTDRSTEQESTSQVS